VCTNVRFGVKRVSVNIFSKAIFPLCTNIIEFLDISKVRYMFDVLRYVFAWISDLIWVVMVALA